MSHLNHGVGVGHHGNKQVQEYDDIDDRVAPEHEEAPEPGVGLDTGQVEGVEPDHAETGPEERLRGLEHAGTRWELRD